MMSSQDVFSNICGTDPPIEDQYLVLSQDRVECPLLGGEVESFIRSTAPPHRAVRYDYNLISRYKTSAVQQ